MASVCCLSFSSARLRSVMSRAIPAVPMKFPCSSYIGVFVVSIHKYLPSLSVNGSSTCLRLPDSMTSLSSALYLSAKSFDHISKSVLLTKSSGLKPHDFPKGSFTAINLLSLSFNQAISGILSRMAFSCRWPSCRASSACLRLVMSCSVSMAADIFPLLSRIGAASNTIYLLLPPRLGYQPSARIPSGMRTELA